jgi:hypothetical protein
VVSVTQSLHNSKHTAEWVILEGRVFFFF